MKVALYASITAGLEEFGPPSAPRQPAERQPSHQQKESDISLALKHRHRVAVMGWGDWYHSCFSVVR